MSDLVVNKTKWNEALFEATQELSKKINTMLISLIRSHYEHDNGGFYDVCTDVIEYFDANDKGELAEYVFALMCKGEIAEYMAALKSDTTQDGGVGK